MTAPTHRLGGIAAGTVLISLMHPDMQGSVCVMLGTMLGSLLPDIDNRHSSISRKWNAMSCIVNVGQKLIRLISNLFTNKQKEYICSLIGHRGLTHSLTALLFFPGMVFLIMSDLGKRWYGYQVAVGLAGGIASHLLLDMLSGGVPLFMPIFTKRVTLLHIKTGGAAEWIFRIILLVIFIFLGMEVTLWRL